MLKTASRSGEEDGPLSKERKVNLLMRLRFRRLSGTCLDSQCSVASDRRSLWLAQATQWSPQRTKNVTTVRKIS